MEDIVEIYHKRWEIELLFKQLKQNFPLRYFYGESANAIKIQIWVTLIANLLLMVMQKRRGLGASPTSQPCSASCSCTTSTATLSSRNRKKIGQRFSRIWNYNLQSQLSLISGGLLFRKIFRNACLSALRMDIGGWFNF